MKKLIIFSTILFVEADREVVLEAVKQNGYALEYASEELQNDPELKKLAPNNSGLTEAFNEDGLLFLT